MVYLIKITSRTKKINSFNKYLLCTFYLPGTGRGARDATVFKSNKIWFQSSGADSLTGKEN